MVRDAILSVTIQEIDLSGVEPFQKDPAIRKRHRFIVMWKRRRDNVKTMFYNSKQNTLVVFRTTILIRARDVAEARLTPETKHRHHPGGLVGCGRLRAAGLCPQSWRALQKDPIGRLNEGTNRHRALYD